MPHVIDLLRQRRLRGPEEEKRERLPFEAGTLAFHHRRHSFQAQLDGTVGRSDMKIRALVRSEVVDRQCFQHRAVVALLCLAVTVCGLVSPALAEGRHVIFVDSNRAGGGGSYDRPFATIREATAVSRPSEVIFVAEAPTPYEESVTLQRGQMLIGSAFGLDVLRAESHMEIDAPPLPAATGTGPVIHGMITLAGDNTVAGLTVTADRKTGVALSADWPQGPLTFRKLYVRTSNDGWGLYVGNTLFPVTWSGGSLDAADHGSGILINGGNGNVSIDHVPVSGDFGDGIGVRARTGGSVVFHDGSPVRIRNSTREAVALSDSKGSIRFDSPLQITTSDGRGFVATNVSSVSVSGGSSWIETTNASAIFIRDASVQIVLDRVTATGVAPGKLVEAITIDKVRGSFQITGDSGQPDSGGTIRDALSYGIRVTQSTGVQMRNMRISGGGTVASTEECPEDVPKLTNLRCRAGLYLRHVEKSAFENLTIEDNGGVGLNANNLIDTTFADVRVSRTGHKSFEPALLIDEARGEIRFTRCAFLDGAGGGIVIEQRFNPAQMIFDRCEIGAPARPAAAPALVRATAGGEGRLDLQFVNTSVHDNAGGGISFLAGDGAGATLTIRDSHVDRVGSSAVSVSGSGHATTSIIITGSHFVAPAVRDVPLVDIDLAGLSGGCLEIAGNELVGGANPLLRARGSQIRVVGGVEALSPGNGGIPVSVDPSATGVTEPCR